MKFTIMDTRWSLEHNNGSNRRRWGKDRFVYGNNTFTYWWRGPLFVARVTGMN